MKRKIFTPLAIGLTGVLTLFALIALTLAPSRTNAQTSTSSGSPDELLRNALQQARNAGSYRVQIDVTQRVLPLPNSDPMLAPMQPHNSETLVYAIEGLVRDAQHMRFSLRDRHASNGLQGSLN
ncbi:MAG: hypothetical protein M1546_08420, partial [Chloroflexi bacterium]|nr:hypothetical protein [Chloroflexota bacterium]